MNILDTSIDIANKYRVLVEADDSFTYQFKFDHEPTTDEIKKEYDRQELLRIKTPIDQLWLLEQIRDEVLNKLNEIDQQEYTILNDIYGTNNTN